MDRTYFIARTELMKVFSPAAARQFEDMQIRFGSTEDAVTANVEATEKIQDATYLTLSPNAELPNERVLTLGDGLQFTVTEDSVRIDLSGVPMVDGGHSIRFVTTGDTEVVLPIAGVLATRDGSETFKNKTLASPKVSNLINAADDGAAAGAGVPVGGMYRNGSALMVRVA